MKTGNPRDEGGSGAQSHPESHETESKENKYKEQKRIKDGLALWLSGKGDCLQASGPEFNSRTHVVGESGLLNLVL